MRACGKLWPSEEAASHSKLVLAGSHVPEPCAYGCEGGWHITRAAKPTTVAKAAAADTGPDRATRALVLTRDGYRCVRCGKPCGPGIAPYSIQHRIARGVGGGNAIPNLILLDGTATTGCHGAVESKKNPHDHPRGYRLESWQDPAAEPVMYASEDGGVTFYLEADGGLTVDAPAVIA